MLALQQGIGILFAHSLRIGYCALTFIFIGMWLFTILNHLFNFVLPACWMATVLLVMHRLVCKRTEQPLPWLRHWLVLFGSGVAVLLVGLIVFQRDGKMMSYVTLVLVMGIVQAWLARRRAGSSLPAEATEMPQPPKD